MMIDCKKKICSLVLVFMRLKFISFISAWLPRTPISEFMQVHCYSINNKISLFVYLIIDIFFVLLFSYIFALVALMVKSKKRNWIIQ